jgi:ADP-ribose pyrophosphatase
MDMHNHKPWTVLSEQHLLSCAPFIEVSKQTVQLPNGRTVENFYQLKMPDFAVMIPEMEDGRFLLLRSYRHGPQRTCLNFPGGHLNDDGEPPLEAAKRELMEETGCVAAEWQALGSFQTNANHRCQTAHFFKARGCRKVAEANSGDLEDTEEVLMTLADIEQAIKRGEFALTTQVAAFALATHPVFGK